MYNLVLTLGHNSSAIIVDDDGSIVVGYENERLSLIKSDSQFPKSAISECLKYVPASDVHNIFVSHWATFGEVDEMSQKHWDRHWLEAQFPSANIFSHIPEKFSHHDAHFLAAKVFAEQPFKWCIVCDGFGNFNEVLSIYYDDKLVHRCFGFDKSLGLLYQYTTAYLGLKMNQDEYKLLGYESKIFDYVDKDTATKILDLSQKLAGKYFRRIIKSQLEPKYDLVAGIEALPSIRENINNVLDTFLKAFGKHNASIEEKRVLIAFYIQETIQVIMTNIIVYFGINEAILTGGVFMNVKLNSKVREYLKRICIYPICGDQGTGLGVYHFYKENLKPIKSLCIGKRYFDKSKLDKVKNLVVHEGTKNALISYIFEDLVRNMIVNVVRGDMEFGARALGNTSTLALPSPGNVDYINLLNDRSTIMPMAGMVTIEQLRYYERPTNIVKSLEFMILTLNLLPNTVDIESVRGCHHIDPISRNYSNRVQLVYDSFYSAIINRLGTMIINTSFNRHGVPIAFNTDQVIDTHLFQLARDIEDRVITYVVI